MKWKLFLIDILLIITMSSCKPYQVSPNTTSTHSLTLQTTNTPLLTSTITKTKTLSNNPTTVQNTPNSTNIIPLLSETPTITMTEITNNNCNIENSGWDGIIKSNIEYLEEVWVTFGVENCKIISWEIKIWYEPAQYYLLVEDTQIPIVGNNFEFDETNQPRGLIIDGWFNTNKTCYGHLGIPKGYFTGTWPTVDVLMVEWFAAKV